jgi:hypothetical protein
LTECTLIVKYFYRVLKLNFKFSKWKRSKNNDKGDENLSIY